MTTRWRRVVIVVLALLGGVLIAYPSAAAWFTAVNQASDVTRYTETTEGLSEQERERLLADATEYNDELTDSPLSDPFIPDPTAPMGTDAAWQQYAAHLSPEPGAPMARLQIPQIDVDLPVYHGTDEATLARGVGHLYGSSLPVGGRGSHAVMTAHNGFTGAEMFDELHLLEEGDEFSVTVAGETLHYRVDRIAVVAPGEIAELRQAQGHDYLTLVTCTPRYINSDRLLVRGERISGGALADPADAAQDPGLPWWIALLLAPPVAAGLFLVWSARRAHLSP